MNYKRYMIISIFTLAFVVVYIYTNKIFNPLGTSLFAFSLALLLLLLTLLFLKKQIFNTWKKFAIFFIAISAIWIFFAPEYCGGGWSGFGGCTFDKETTAMFTVGLFLIISLIIIMIKSWKLRKRN